MNTQIQTQTPNSQKTQNQTQTKKTYLTFCPEDFDPEIDTDIECYQFYDDTDY